MAYKARRRRPATPLKRGSIAITGSVEPRTIVHYEHGEAVPPNAQFLGMVAGEKPMYAFAVPQSEPITDCKPSI